MSALLRKMARGRPTPVSLANLFRYGQMGTRDTTQRVRNAQFLHNELQIRIAQRVVELETLPLNLPQTRHIQDVIGWYTDYFDQVASSPFPETIQDDEDFTRLLNFILQDNSEVIETTARGVVEVRQRQQGFSLRDQQEVDKVFNSFYLARIGLRFLIEHHVRSGTDREGFAGIIEGKCDPLLYAELAADEASSLCQYHLGDAPRFVITRLSSGGGDSFTYVPGHLMYVLTEVFKNAARATAEFHADAPTLPPVKVNVVCGKRDVTFRVSDQGGGIRRENVPLVWSYLHTTADNAQIVADENSSSSKQTAALAGYGVGLPLSRLYARYFGGDLDLKSMEGYGTDAYLHLSRLGDNCENLPSHVAHSPAEGASMIERGLSSSFFFGKRDSWGSVTNLSKEDPSHPLNLKRQVIQRMPSKILLPQDSES